MRYISKSKLLITGLAGCLLVGAANAQSITIDNFSFEADVNTDANGAFSPAAGSRGAFPGDQLTSWTALSGGVNDVAVGFRDINSGQLDGNQALSLVNGASVLNTTSTAWASFAVGETLTLTISLGGRDLDTLSWNESTFFGLTDDDAVFTDGITTSDTVASSGIIANNPATGTQTGDGTFTDVSFDYTIVASDVNRNGNVGILIYAEGTGPGVANSTNQSFFDNVRLSAAPIPEPSSFALLAGLLGLGFAMLRRR